MAEDHDDAEVRYTVRDLLDRIRADQSAGFARIETAMSGKADKADVARLEARLDQHARRLDGNTERLADLEQQQRDQRTTREWWTGRAARVGGSFVGCALVAGNIAAVLTATHVI